MRRGGLRSRRSHHRGEHPHAGCISSGPAGTGHPTGARTIVVGVSGAFAENQLIAEMYAQVLEHAGYTVEREFDLRSREVSQSALESGQIDLKPEYMSSLLLFLDANVQTSSDPTDVATTGRRVPPSERHRGAQRRRRPRTRISSWRTRRRRRNST